jgi:hypothetical protein
MGSLAGGWRQLRGRNQAMPEHFLLVFAVKQQQSWEQILNVLEQAFDFRESFAFVGRHPFPPWAIAAYLY